jgi:hypothetical protein
LDTQQAKFNIMTPTFIFALSLLASPLSQQDKTLPYYENEAPAVSSESVTIHWENVEVNELELRSDYHILIPSIPTDGTKQIHLNYLEDGNYFLLLKTDGEIVEIRKFQIENKKLLAQNNITTPH